MDCSRFGRWRFVDYSTVLSERLAYRADKYPANGHSILRNRCAQPWGYYILAPLGKLVYVMLCMRGLGLDQLLDNLRRYQTSPSG